MCHEDKIWFIKSSILQKHKFIERRSLSWGYTKGISCSLKAKTRGVSPGSAHRIWCNLGLRKLAFIINWQQDLSALSIWYWFGWHERFTTKGIMKSCTVISECCWGQIMCVRFENPSRRSFCEGVKVMCVY